MPPENGEEVKCNPRSNNHQVSAKEVVVHELSSKPTDFWKRWSKTAKVMRLQVEIVLEIYLILTHFLPIFSLKPNCQHCENMKVRPPSSPPEENKLRFVCMADTHSLTSHLKV